MSSTLPTDAAARNEYPLADGLLYYFPNALAEIARISKIGNDQHNPGEPMHWARNKSTDHANKILRHQLEAGTMDTDGTRHSGKVAWRALAQLEDELIAAGATPGRNAIGEPAPKAHRRVATPAELAAYREHQPNTTEDKWGRLLLVGDSVRVIDPTQEDADAGFPHGAHAKIAGRGVGPGAPVCLHRGDVTRWFAGKQLERIA